MLIDGSKVYKRTRIQSPPLYLQEAYHRMYPVDQDRGRLKKLISNQRRMDPAKFQRAMALQEARRNSATAPVKSAAALKMTLREKYDQPQVSTEASTSASTDPTVRADNEVVTEDESADKQNTSGAVE